MRICGIPTSKVKGPKIRYIKKHAENKKSTLHKYFGDDLLDRILVWKDERNRLIHALLKQQLTDDDVIGLATAGNELTYAIRTRTNAYNRAIEKVKASS